MAWDLLCLLLTSPLQSWDYRCMPLFLASMWVPGMALRSPGLVAKHFTRWAILLAPDCILSHLEWSISIAVYHHAKCLWRQWWLDWLEVSDRSGFSHWNLCGWAIIPQCYNVTCSFKQLHLFPVTFVSRIVQVLDRCAFSQLTFSTRSHLWLQPQVIDIGFCPAVKVMNGLWLISFSFTYLLIYLGAATHKIQ